MQLWSKSKKISIFIFTVDITVEKKKKKLFLQVSAPWKKGGQKNYIDKKFLSTVVYHH